MKNFKMGNVIDKATTILMGGMFISMSFAALTIAVSAVLDII